MFFYIWFFLIISWILSDTSCGCRGYIFSFETNELLLSEITIAFVFIPTNYTYESELQNYNLFVKKKKRHRTNWKDLLIIKLKWNMYIYILFN